MHFSQGELESDLLSICRLGVIYVFITIYEDTQGEVEGKWTKYLLSSPTHTSQFAPTPTHLTVIRDELAY